jgi:ABC-2 type transport system permease protein
MLRYLGLFALQLRTALLLALQYRLDFALSTLLGLFWAAVALVPLAVLFTQRDSVAGWRWPEALVVVSLFLLLKSFLSGAIQPSILIAVEQIRTGALDFLLLKPADAQFLLSTARFDLARLADAVAGGVLISFALRHTGTDVTVLGVLGAAILFAGGAAILYSLFIAVLSLAFVFVKIDNLSYLLSSVFDAARWPASVFRGALAVVFTFVLPLALMTTYPALALLGRIDVARIVIALVTAAVFLALSRLVFRRAIGHYTSAGG